MTQDQRAKLVRYMQGMLEKTEMVFTMSGGSHFILKSPWRCKSTAELQLRICC